eukprot:ANDGO_05600.mRNA.1 hypothetical protein
MLDLDVLVQHGSTQDVEFHAKSSGPESSLVVLKARIRRACEEDVGPASHLVHTEFRRVTDFHRGFLDITSDEYAAGFMGPMIMASADRCICLAVETDFASSAERTTDGKWEMIAFNGLDLETDLYSVGPIAVDKRVQAFGIGKWLMKTTVELSRHLHARNAAADRSYRCRLTQDAFNAATISIYAQLGFRVVEPLAFMIFDLTAANIQRLQTRLAAQLGDARFRVDDMQLSDVDSCHELGIRVLSMQFGRMLHSQLAEGSIPGASVVRDVQAGQVLGWSTGITDIDKITIAADQSSFRYLLAHMVLRAYSTKTAPTRAMILIQTRFLCDEFVWLMDGGWRTAKQNMQMAIGEYNTPRGFATTAIQGY